MDYRIRVQGHLDPSWQHHFEELRLEHEDAETILLSGALPDRGAQTAQQFISAPLNREYVELTKHLQLFKLLLEQKLAVGRKT